MVYGQKEELVFLGREIGEQRDYSESVAEKIDDEVRKIVQVAYERAESILIEYRAQLDAIAVRLIEVETLDRAAFEALFAEPVIPKNGGTPIPVVAEAAS
jgi:cell division protease FtsH